MLSAVPKISVVCIIVWVRLKEKTISSNSSHWLPEECSTDLGYYGASAAPAKERTSGSRAHTISSSDSVVPAELLSRILFSSRRLVGFFPFCYHIAISCCCCRCCWEWVCLRSAGGSSVMAEANICFACQEKWPVDCAFVLRSESGYGYHNGTCSGLGESGAKAKRDASLKTWKCTTCKTVKSRSKQASGKQKSEHERILLLSWP